MRRPTGVGRAGAGAPAVFAPAADARFVRQRRHDTVKRLGLAVGLLITAAGVFVSLVPSAVIRFAQHGVTALELYASAITRVGIGVLLIIVASTSRLPRLLRVFGVIAVMAGMVTPFLGVARAQTIADWVSHQGLAVVRAFGLLALAIGAAIVYACGPRRRVAA